MPMNQEDEVTVTVTVTDVDSNPPTALLAHDTLGLRGAKRRITQKVAVPDPELFARAASWARTAGVVQAVIVTQWREDGSVSYLRDLIPKVDSRNGSNGAGSNGPSMRQGPTLTTKLPAMVKEK